jgi:hypothetical protein
MKRKTTAPGRFEDHGELQLPRLAYTPGKIPRVWDLAICGDLTARRGGARPNDRRAERARTVMSLTILQRTFLHLTTARWLAYLRGDWKWERACRVAIETVRKLKTRIRSEAEKKAA